jgi:hypothetical protein
MPWCLAEELALPNTLKPCLLRLAESGESHKSRERWVEYRGTFRERASAAAARNATSRDSDARFSAASVGCYSFRQEHNP